ncbi:MAG: hypothetical protein C7B43_13800 [Sulfobacillus benefaciens]|uniref:Transposase DDE domain-containing protein n=1 Tax=Sulfobacillus benefaciens TaxID=453960 RepID=A0A2T2WWD8_9FIRM|nr:MAG: hypothetical protein C7B43_13800 [Sulfobacillus benefaciens]
MPIMTKRTIGDNDWLVTSQGGLGVIGQLLAATPLGAQLTASQVPEADHPDTSHRDVVFSVIGLLAQGQPDYDHIEAFRHDPFFALALSLDQVPSSPTLRQRLDQAATHEDTVHWNPLWQEATDTVLAPYINCHPIRIGGTPDVPLDVDVSPFDNGKTKKEGVSREGHADFLIKRNLRREAPEDWLALARAEGHAVTPREGKITYRGATMRSPRVGDDPERVVYEVVERTITAEGQTLLFPDIAVATYWTSLSQNPADILPWYPDHGTMEPYHSEYKTDMNLERLPSGKFATNQLILQIALLTFNLLRIMGQATLGNPHVPLRQPVVRRRLRTVIQNLVFCAARLIRHARREWACYARHNPWRHVLGSLYAQLT